MDHMRISGTEPSSVTYNSDVMNIPVQNGSFLREIYYLVKKYVDCQKEIIEQLKAQ